MERVRDRVAAAYVRLRLAWRDGRLTQQVLSDRLKEFDHNGELGNLTQGTLSRLLNNEKWGSDELRREVLRGLEGILENDFGVVYDKTVADYVVEGDPAAETGGGMSLSPEQAEQLMVAPSEPLDSIAGTYVLFYRGADPHHGLVRRYFVKIDSQGNAEAYTRRSWTGKAMRYGHLLWVWLWSSNTREIQGCLFFSLDHEKISGKDELKSFQGLLINTTRNQESIARRIVMLRTSITDLYRPLGHLSISGKWGELDEEAPGLKNLFIPQSVNQIRSPRTVNFRHFRARHDFGKSCFYAACYLAQQGHEEEAKRELEQAFRDGFYDIPMMLDATRPGAPLEQLLSWFKDNLGKYSFVGPMKA